MSPLSWFPLFFWILSSGERQEDGNVPGWQAEVTRGSGGWGATVCE